MRKPSIVEVTNMEVSPELMASQSEIGHCPLDVSG